ncbi:MAG TPA: sodium:proton antiporter [Rhodospirillaceae bacterium]|jgi:Na+/H+ antiporter NhaD/arsenite permease-like protein|nr:sodium:proton antiporter NhaD [Alphaproteobacteria bacterium]HBH25850.1 sodium:proton antiporter [Rhodospirillaceae bacterium]
MLVLRPLLSALLICLMPTGAWASAVAEDGCVSPTGMDLVGHPAGWLCLLIFFASYAAVFAEEYTHMKKSKPVMLGASLIWVVVAFVAPAHGVGHESLRSAVLHGLEEYASLLLFLLSAMTYIAALLNRGVFDVLKDRLIRAGLGYRGLFWATGVLAFFLSPIADNLTTALVLGAVVVVAGVASPHFVAIACVNVVNAANAGGAFSPFGDITTLMVWQAGRVDFLEFFVLFFPSLACFLVPATIMQFWVPRGRPDVPSMPAQMRRGARAIIVLGLLTISMAVGFEQALGLPPFVGMMAGLSLLMIATYIITHGDGRPLGDRRRGGMFDVFDLVAESEWDTLFFFFGVIFSVGGLAYIGYLEVASEAIYGTLGFSWGNIVLGLVSAAVDNIPVMFAVLSMNPPLDHFQWLLITLATGVGGSLVSIGSAAGVALMGVARGRYGFMTHLRWTPVLLLGYAAAMTTHFLVNGP